MICSQCNFNKVISTVIFFVFSYKTDSLKHCKMNCISVFVVFMPFLP